MTSPMESTGRKSTVTVLYDYAYKSHDELVSIKEGERLILIEKTNSDWWQVRRPGGSRPFYAPGTYLHEDGTKNKSKACQNLVAKTETTHHKHLPESKSDDCLLTPEKKWSAIRNTPFRKQRSTSMDAIMFLELLENEIKDMPSSSRMSKLEEKFKKPRISKDIWDRRKSWAVEELVPHTKITPKLTCTVLKEPVRSDRQKILIHDKHHSSNPPKNVTPPPRPPRLVRSDGLDKGNDNKFEDKAPALPPKKNRGVVCSSVLTPDPSPEKRENYSRVTPLNRTNVEGKSETGKSKLGPGVRHLSESLEKLAQQIQFPKGNKTPLVTTSAVTSMELPSPPDLPPKKIISAKPSVAKRTVYKSNKDNEAIPENYVNLRPVTVVGSVEDIASDESGVNMSFNNPLFVLQEKHSRKHVQDQLSSSQELESSVEDGIHLKSMKNCNSLSSSEIDGNASSNEDLLSSKDSLNSIPLTPTKATSVTARPSPPPVRNQRPKRELFEGWVEYEDRSGRPFYYNLDTKVRSWKPPRRKGFSPMMKGTSIEEEVSELVHSAVDNNNGSHFKTELTTLNQTESAHNQSYPSAPIGWEEQIDSETGEIVYLNPTTGERWLTSSDSEGRIYYYEEISQKSEWNLPELYISNPKMDTETIQQGVFYPEGSKLNPSHMSSLPIISEPIPKSDRVRSKQKESKMDRSSKTKSMVLTHSSGTVENVPLVSLVGSTSTSKSASLPRNIPQWPTLQAGSIVSDYLTNLDIRVIRQGILQKTKLTENGRKLRKNWTSSLTVLTDLFLLIFKDPTSKTSSTTPPSTTEKPELCVDLNGATIEWAAEKSSRKGVFQVTTLLGLQLLLQDEEEPVFWFNEIEKAIQQLPCGSRDNTNAYPAPLASPNARFYLQGCGPDMSKLEHSTALLTPPSPDDNIKESKKNRLGRSKSTKVQILGSTEDLVSSGASPAERQVKLRDKLRKFFVRRPTMDTLMRKGIYKDEPVFGRELEDLCLIDGQNIPKFVQRVIELIEAKPENMRTDGIYRASGNLSQVQKIRLQVDQNNWAILEQEDDVHVLTGCLKLFFRELKEPLIPCQLFEKALKTVSIASKSERIKKVKDLVNSLPQENYDTLKFLLKHLLKITEYKDQNRMHCSNVAIVFGPTIMWPATESANLASDMMQQNLVVENLLINYEAIFG